ncbi:hypothetical protein FRC06_010161 [Ceratobasidium sp. 370]|nr:hypothetical protein FRC06_010161 [Ceratobasidium sp. 370]
MSGAKHPLELVLQNHLGTDSAALTHLSEVLPVLKQLGIFDTANSGVLGKWNARINSLLHSREASSRWVGLVLAKYTATSSRHILVENAQGWKAEPFPNHHAAVRLLTCLFTSVTDMPEFQRQVVIPNVQKCSLALLALAKSEESNLALKVLAVDALTQFTTHHPTHHRALQQNLHSFTLEHLQGSFPLASSTCLLLDQSTTSLPAAATRLHAILPLTGGKVGASVTWRKSVDSAIGTIWSLLGTLRRTYGDVFPTTIPPPFTLPRLPDDPAIAAPLALDRLRCMIRTPTARPVSMPLGSLSQLALKLIQCTTAEPTQPPQTPYEPVQRTVEAVAVPELCVAGCMLAQQLSQTCGKLFTPYVSRFLNAITYQLDQPNLSK